MNVLTIEAHRDGYSVDQVYETMTVGDLIYELENYPEDTPVYISNDRGYTYGGISEDDLSLKYVEEEEEEEEEEEDEDSFEESNKPSKRLKRNFL